MATLVQSALRCYFIYAYTTTKKSEAFVFKNIPKLISISYNAPGQQKRCRARADRVLCPRITYANDAHYTCDYARLVDNRWMEMKNIFLLFINRVATGLRIVSPMKIAFIFPQFSTQLSCDIVVYDQQQLRLIIN